MPLRLVAEKRDVPAVVAHAIGQRPGLRKPDEFDRQREAPSNLSIIGRYVLMPEVIGYIARMHRGAGGEVQLTDAMAMLIGEQPFHGLRYEGRRFDCGDKAGFLEAQIAFALKRPDLADTVRSFLGQYR